MDTFNQWTGHDMTIAFAAVNIFGAIMVAFLMMLTTPHASIRGAPHDPQAMWGMVRRLLYMVYIGGLMGMGLWVVKGWIVLSNAESAFWLMVTVPIGIFLFLRAMHFVDQDYWIGLHRDDRNRSVYEDLRAQASTIQNPVRRARVLGLVDELNMTTTTRR